MLLRGKICADGMLNLKASQLVFSLYYQLTLRESLFSARASGRPSKAQCVSALVSKAAKIIKARVSGRQPIIIKRLSLSSIARSSSSDRNPALTCWALCCRRLRRLKNFSLRNMSYQEALSFKLRFTSTCHASGTPGID